MFDFFVMVALIYICIKKAIEVATYGFVGLFHEYIEIPECLILFLFWIYFLWVGNIFATEATRLASIIWGFDLQ